jgi:hypothetical protein
VRDRDRDQSEIDAPTGVDPSLMRADQGRSRTIVYQSWPVKVKGGKAGVKRDLAGRRQGRYRWQQGGFARRNSPRGYGWNVFKKNCKRDL